MSKLEKNQSSLEKRIDKAIQRHDSLEQRLQRLRTLPGTHKKPLTRAEREFKLELGKSIISHKSYPQKIDRNSFHHLVFFRFQMTKKMQINSRELRWMRFNHPLKL